MTASGHDYRTSHLQKGEDYDSYLAVTPFDRYLAREESKVLGKLLDRLFPRGIPAYLDFACGTGRITTQVEARARACYAVDVSETMVAEARRKCTQTRFLIADITRQPLDVGTFDLITAFRFFGNAQDELRHAVLDSIHRLLRPGGYLVINNHRNSWSIRNLLLRATGQPADGDLSYLKMRRLLGTHGFTVLRTYGIGVWLVRARVIREEAIDSRVARLLDPVSRLPLLAPFCPDAVILARRTS